MSPEGTSLTALFALPDNHDFHQRVLTIGAGTEEDLSGMKSGIAKLIKGLQWKVIEGEVKKKTLEALDVDAVDLIATTWDKYKTLAEFAQKSKSEGEAAHVSLAEHSINAELHPYLVIEVDKVLHKKIVFDVSLEFDLKALVLKIENGRIVEVEAGSCEGSGEIKIEEHSLLKKDFGAIDLPGKVRLGKGIAVA